MFQLGSFYTREEIHEALGGGVVEYLPHKDGKVVCGCVTTDANPDAPDIILPGRGPEIQHWAEVFRHQAEPVPIFVKRAEKRWEYVGDYRVERWSEDESEIASHSLRSGRSDITSVLVLTAGH